MASVVGVSSFFRKEQVPHGPINIIFIVFNNNVIAGNLNKKF